MDAYTFAVLEFGIYPTSFAHLMPFSSQKKKEYISNYTK